MRTLTEKYLGGLALAEDIYKVDLAVLDRYQSFSSELLRLSLLGIAGYGFLITNVVFKVTTSAGQFVFFTPFSQARFVLAGGAITLGVSATTALAHRYFSTDCITHYVRRLRQVQRLKDLSEQSEEWKKAVGIIEQEQISLKNDLSKCKWLLLFSSLFLVLGACSVAVTFAATLFWLQH